MSNPARHLGFTSASLLVVALIASGCGSSSSKSAAAAGSSTTGAAATPPVSAAAVTTTVKATGGGYFCKKLADFINSGESLGTTPDAVKAAIQKSQAETLVLREEAPSAIKTDLATLFSATDGLYAQVAKAGYDFTKVPPSAVDALSTPEVKAAETRTDAYVKTKCGIDVGPSS